MRRGDIVVARFPYAGGHGNKVRPAVIVQGDRLNRQIHNPILAMISGNTRLAGAEPAQLLVDPTTPEGASSGLTMPSAIKCEHLAVVTQSEVIDIIGHLSDPLKQKLDTCLRAALEL